jgi:hypothetical protein
MTALVGRDVERTLSARSRFLTGHLLEMTDQAGGQDFGEFKQSSVRGIHARGLAQNPKISIVSVRMSKGAYSDVGGPQSAEHGSCEHHDKSVAGFVTLALARIRLIRFWPFP